MPVLVKFEDADNPGALADEVYVQEGKLLKIEREVQQSSKDTDGAHVRTYVRLSQVLPEAFRVASTPMKGESSIQLPLLSSTRAMRLTAPGL